MAAAPSIPVEAPPVGTDTIDPTGVSLTEQVAVVRALLADAAVPVAEQEQAVMNLGVVLAAESDRLARAAGVPEDLLAQQAARQAERDVLAEQATALGRELSEIRRARFDAAPDSVEKSRLYTQEQDLERQIRDLYQQIREVEDAANAWRREHLGTYAAAYRQVLGEIRPLGGAITGLTEDADRASVRILNEALANYPAEWIEQANAHRTKVRVRTTKARAHYVASTTIAKKKRQREGHLWRSHNDEAPYEDRPATEFVRVTDLTAAQRTELGWDENMMDSMDDVEHLWVGLEYEVFSRYRNRSRDGMPVGPGWQQVRVKDTWAHDADPDGYVTVWRRPRMKMATTGHSSSAVLTVDRDGSPVGEKGHATAGHEFAHRMQHVKPTLGALEEEHIRRRTTSEAGQRHPTERYHGRSSEKIRPDGFANQYMGKDYGTQTYHELLSCGMEALFQGNHGGLVGLGPYKTDPESRAFVLGMLAAG